MRFWRENAKCWCPCSDKVVEQNELEMCLHEKVNQMSHKRDNSLTKKMSGSSRNLKYILPAILSGCYQKCLSRGEECCQKFPLSVDPRCPILRAGFFSQTRDLVLHFTFGRFLVCRKYYCHQEYKIVTWKRIYTLNKSWLICFSSLCSAVLWNWLRHEFDRVGPPF